MIRFLFRIIKIEQHRPRTTCYQRFVGKFTETARRIFGLRPKPGTEFENYF